jgi:predicted fused transcriptional regulator/phosphomethylpyrimidine kinase
MMNNKKKSMLNAVTETMTTWQLQEARGVRTDATRDVIVTQGHSGLEAQII